MCGMAGLGGFEGAVLKGAMLILSISAGGLLAAAVSNASWLFLFFALVFCDFLPPIIYRLLGGC